MRCKGLILPRVGRTAVFSFPGSHIPLFLETYSSPHHPYSSWFACIHVRVTVRIQALWKVLVSHVWLFATPGTVAHQAPLSLRFSRQEWVAISSSRGSSWPKDWTWVSCIAGRFSTIWATREAPALWGQWFRPVGSLTSISGLEHRHRVDAKEVFVNEVCAILTEG